MLVGLPRVLETGKVGCRRSLVNRAAPYGLLAIVALLLSACMGVHSQCDPQRVRLDYSGIDYPSVLTARRLQESWTWSMSALDKKAVVVFGGLIRSATIAS